MSDIPTVAPSPERENKHSPLEEVPVRGDQLASVVTASPPNGNHTLLREKKSKMAELSNEIAKKSKELVGLKIQLETAKRAHHKATTAFHGAKRDMEFAEAIVTNRTNEIKAETSVFISKKRLLAFMRQDANKIARRCQIDDFGSPVTNTDSQQESLQREIIDQEAASLAFNMGDPPGTLNTPLMPEQQETDDASQEPSQES